jgi:carbon-monoxide dehydrogenase medium subunit
VAGGVAVLLGRALGRPSPGRSLAIGGLDELRILEREGDGILLGAGLTLDTIAADPRVPALLRAAAHSTADAEIRAMATLGGNVVAGRAASDPVAALVALGATARVAARAGERAMPVAELVHGGVPAGSLIRAFAVRDEARWGWQRLTMRGAGDRSAASVAVALREVEASVATTWVAERVIRFAGAAAAILADATDEAAIRDAAAGDLAGVDLLEDDRASAAYRRRVLPVLVARAAADAAARDRRPDG